LRAPVFDPSLRLGDARRQVLVAPDQDVSDDLGNPPTVGTGCDSVR
jgi:hypothetical protein